MTPTQPLISIIVPIYNADQYLEECLSSIQSQSYESFEAILINDGSTDNSKKIAEKYCQRDTRFKLINQPNSGVASARQAGLNHINGEYVIHADADDRMMSNSLSDLYQCIVKNNSDIAIGAYIEEATNTKELITRKHDKDITKEQLILNLLEGIYHSALWNKLIKSELLEGVSFEENIDFMEDKLFLLKVLKQDSAKIAMTNKVVYFYRSVEDSYTSQISEQSIQSAIKVTNKLTNLFSESFSDVFFNHLKNKIKIMILLNSNKSVKNIFPETNTYLLKDKNIPLRHKLVVLADWLNIKGASKIYRKLHRLT